MDFKVGDTLALETLQTRLEKNKNYIMNTSWYIFPFPIFELADRNFNVWWSEQNRSFKRVNYGIRFVHLNTTGRRDPLKLQFHLGYTQKLELVYSFPALNKSQTFGVIGEFFYARNKEIAYKTVDHRLAFERREEEFPLQRFRSGRTRVDLSAYGICLRKSGC